MFGPGLAAGLNAGMRDIEGRRRQEMLDAERQEDRGMRREQFDMQKEQYGLQMAEIGRERDMREQRGLLAQGAMERQPYAGGDVNDPQFGIQAQADMGGMGNGLGLLSGLKTNEKQLNTGRYLSDMERHYAEAGDVEQATKLRQAAEGIRKEGGVEAVKRLIAGDIQGAERVWNTTGSERIQPGSIKVDGDNVSWVNSQGKQVEMPLPALMDLVGIKKPETTADWVVTSLGDGRYVQHNKRTSETRPHEGLGAGGPGSMSNKDVETMAERAVAKGMGINLQDYSNFTPQTHMDFARLKAEVVREYRKDPASGLNVAHERVMQRETEEAAANAPPSMEELEVAANQLNEEQGKGWFGKVKPTDDEALERARENRGGGGQAPKPPGAPVQPDKSGDPILESLKRNAETKPPGAPVQPAQQKYKVNTADDYNKVPSGATYIDPKGVERVKR